MGTFRLLWPYLRRQRGVLLVSLLLAMVAALAGTQPPALLRTVVDQLRLNQDLAQQPGLINLLLRYGGLILLAAAVTSVLNFGLRLLVGRASYAVEYELRNDLFGHLMRLDQAFYGQHHTGDLMARMTNDLSAVRQMLGPGLLQIMGPGILIIVAAVLMLGIDLPLALVALTMLPTISLSFAVIGRRMRDRFGKVQTQFGELSTRAQENFSGIRTIKAYAQEVQEIAAFREGNEQYRKFNLSYVLLNGLIWPMMALLIGVTAGLILLVGGQAVASGRITLGEFVQFNSYVGLLTWPMIALGWTVTLVQQGAASLIRINEVLAHMPNVQTPQRPQTPAQWQGAVEFRNVGLRYGDRWIVRDVSFSIPQGGSLAIVGPTGAGKTTLVNLLGRVQDPTEGQILIDGVDVRNIALDELRRQLSYVPQDTFLFSTPLRDNITFGRQDAPEAAITHALEVSQLINDVPQFPNGIDTVIGERGVTLSGGQKQRTAIARGVLRDPTILILDDAMSSVDTHTAGQILQHLREQMQDRTSIIIAQRIATVKDADQILVLHDGAIAERGTHSALVKHDGLYAAMYRRELLRSEMEVA